MKLNLESVMLTVAECRNAHAKAFKELSLKDTSQMSLSEQQENLKKMLVLHGAITAYDYVLSLCEGEKEGVK